MRSLAVAVCVVTSVLAHAQPRQALTPQMSPRVTWDPYLPGARPPTKRALSAAELKTARERADRVFDVFRASPSFNTPAARITLVTSWAVVAENGVIQQDFIVYWSDPRDVRTRPDGSLWPAVGGAHELAFFTTNRPPGANRLEDRATRGNFSRGVENDGLPTGAFAAPREFGEVGGGTFYANTIVLTKDGRPALEPAPVGALVEGEVARLRKAIDDQERGRLRAIDQLDATMTDEAKQERRARRAERWKTETRDPAALAARLDAADRSDESDYQRQKQQRLPPPGRDPKSVYWGPRMALEAHERQLEALGASRTSAACGRVDTAFNAGDDVRYEPIGTRGGACVPMVRVRPDLVDTRRPSEVQLLTVTFSSDVCGEYWAGTPSLQSTLCERAVPLLREIDWVGLRGAMGW